MTTTTSHRTLVSLLAAAAMAVGLAGTAAARPSHGGKATVKVRDHRAQPTTTLVQAQWGKRKAIPATPKRQRPAKTARNGKRHKGERGKAVWIARWDSNHDGVLSVTEKRMMKRERFAALDANHDGKLTYLELSRSMKKRNRGKHRGDAARKRSTQRSAFGRTQRIAKKFARLDLDSDGVITRYEFVNATPYQGTKTHRGRGPRSR